MNPILENVLQNFEGPLIATIAQRLGVDQATAQKAVAVAVPIILAVLAHRGASAAGQSNAANPLGPNSAAVAQGISQSAGISTAQAQQLLSIVTPMAVEHLQTQKASPQQAAGEHAKQIAPALSAGDHQSIVNAVTSLGKAFLAGPPAGRLL